MKTITIRLPYVEAAMLAEVQSGERLIVGVRTRWAGPQQAMLIRKVTFTRLNNADSAMESNVNR